jgi:serine/threonine protein kinase
VKLLPRADADYLHQVLFRREIMALSRLSHPNIVLLPDYGEDDGQNAFYLIFPWVDRQLRDELPSPDDVDWGWDTFAQKDDKGPFSGSSNLAGHRHFVGDAACA